jgi:hypothetical protein
MPLHFALWRIYTPWVPGVLHRSQHRRVLAAGVWTCWAAAGVPDVVLMTSRLNEPGSMCWFHHLLCWDLLPWPAYHLYSVGA